MTWAMVFSLEAVIFLVGGSLTKGNLHSIFMYVAALILGVSSLMLRSSI